MRTTVSIDDDLMAQIEDLRQREGLSLKAALNKLLRAGIEYQARPPKPKPYKTRARRLGLRAGLDPTKLNQLVDEMEAEKLTDSSG